MNKKLITTLALTGATIGAIITGCGTDTQDLSKTKAMSSSDWFKDGVDRFYLAHLDSKTKIDDAYNYTYGDRFFIGVGCYGEPEDQHSLVKVKASAFSSDEITIPLSQRTMLHQFPITESDTPKKGECKIILGSSINARQIINDASLEVGGDRSNVTEKLAGTTLGCFGLLAMSTKFVATAVAGGYATAQTAGAAAPVIIPAIVADASGVLTAGFYCTLKTGESMEAIGEYQVAENQKLFTKTLLKASEKAKYMLQASGNISSFEQLSNAADPQKKLLASAMWNKALVKTFNSEIEEEFENGWGNRTKFFDAIEQIKTEAATKVTPY